MDHAIPAALVLPFVVASVLVFLGRRLSNAVIAISGAFTSLVVAGLGVHLVLEARARPLVYSFGGYALEHGFPVGIAFYVDAAAAAASVLAGVLGFAGFVFAATHMRTAGATFHALLLVFVGALTGMCFTADLFNLFALFELANVSASALIAYRIEEAGPVQGGFNFLVVMGAAGAFALFGIALLYARTGALDLAQVSATLASRPAGGLVRVAFALLAVALLTKAGLVPFHFAHADAHAAAPTSVLVLFSGVLLAEGLYLFARIARVVFAGLLAASEGRVRALLVAIGLTTAILAAVLAYAQQHLKRLLAFSSIAHMGVAQVGLGLFDPVADAGAGLALGAHGLVVAALFLCVGVILDRCGVLDEARLARRPSRYGPIAALFVAGGFAVAAPYPTASFFAETWIADAAHRAGFAWIEPALAFSSIVTAAAIFRVAGRIFFGLQPPQPDTQGPRDDPEVEQPPLTQAVAPSALSWVIGLLLVAPLFLGGFISEARGVLQAAAELGSDALYRNARLGGAAVAVPIPTAPPITMARVARSFVHPILALAFAALSIAHARLPRVWRSAMERLEAPITALRSLHSGAIGDYVAFFLLGAAILVGALALGPS